MDDQRLREIRKANDLPVKTILRLAWIASAEEQSMRAIHRPLTHAELRLVIEAYPPDAPDRRRRR